MVQAEFSALTLLSIGPKTLAQLRENPAWAERLPCYLRQVLSRLAIHGFVATAEIRVPRTRSDGRFVAHLEKLYSLTDAGLTALAEERTLRNAELGDDRLPDLTRPRQRIAPKLPPANPDRRPNERERRSLLEWAEKHDPDFGHLCSAIWAEGGLYFEEALSLNWRDVELEKGKIVIRRGPREGLLQISPELRVAIEACRVPSSDRLLFTNCNGQKHNNQRTFRLGEFLRIKRRAGITRRVGLLEGAGLSADELREIERVARPNAALFVRALASRVLDFEQVASLRTSDINLADRTVCVGGIWRPMKRAFERAVRPALAPRTSGHVFRDAKAYPRNSASHREAWQRGHVHEVFARARSALGLPSHVHIIGRGNMWSVKRKLRTQVEHRVVRAAQRQRATLEAARERSSIASAERGNAIREEFLRRVAANGRSVTQIRMELAARSLEPFGEEISYRTVLRKTV